MPTNPILPSSPAPLTRAARVPDLLIAALLAVLTGLLFIPLHPLADVPMNDDFSWARSAKAFADTGKIVYNGWGNPILLPHIIIGGLLTKLFGFSHIILSGFGIVSGMAFAASVYLLARACDIRRSLSIFVAALTVLNPVFLGCTPSFMSDVPSAFLYTCALLAFIRALRIPEGGDGRYALRPLPLVLALLFALLAGANRQLLWAALLLAFATAFFCLVPSERWKRLVPALAVIVTVAVGLSAWFAAQPYSVSLSLAAIPFYWQSAPDLLFWVPFKFVALLSLAALPITLPLLAQRWKSTQRAAPMLLACLAAGVIPLLIFLVQPNSSKQIWNGRWELNNYGQYVGWQGIQVGGPNGYDARPAMISPNVGIMLYVLGALAIGVLLWTILAALKRRPVSSCVLLIGALAQVVLPMPWYASGAAFDRYLLTIVPTLLIALLASNPPVEDSEASVGSASWEANRGTSSKLFWLGVPVAAVYAVVGLLFAQEYFAGTQARAALYKTLTVDKRIPPQFVDAGVETTGDTQILLAGHVNNPNIKNPPSTFDDLSKGNCVFAPFFFPVMDARLMLFIIYPAPDLSRVASRDTLNLQPEPLMKEDYYSIIPPHKRTVYVYAVRKTEGL